MGWQLENTKGLSTLLEIRAVALRQRNMIGRLRRIPTLLVLGLFGSLIFTESAMAGTTDRCGARRLAHFIGKPVALLQWLKLPKARFLCEGCGRTADYHPDRINVE